MPGSPPSRATRPCPAWALSRSPRRTASSSSRPASGMRSGIATGRFGRRCGRRGRGAACGCTGRRGRGPDRGRAPPARGPGARIPGSTPSSSRSTTRGVPGRPAGRRPGGRTGRGRAPAGRGSAPAGDAPAPAPTRGRRPRLARPAASRASSRSSWAATTRLVEPSAASRAKRVLHEVGERRSPHQLECGADAAQPLPRGRRRRRLRGRHGPDARSGTCRRPPGSARGRSRPLAARPRLDRAPAAATRSGPAARWPGWRRLVAPDLVDQALGGRPGGVRRARASPGSPSAWRRRRAQRRRHGAPRLRRASAHPCDPPPPKRTGQEISTT